MEAEALSNPSETKLHFLDYWRIIRIRKMVIFTVFLLVVITTAGVTYVMPKKYTSSVRIDVQKDVSDVAMFNQTFGGQNYDPFFVLTQFERIQSKEVLYRVIDDLKLVQRWNQKYLLGESKLKAYEMLLKIMDPRNVRNTSIIEVNVYSKDKAEAADIANKIAEVYKTNRDQQRKRLTTDGLKIYKDKLAEANALVAEARSNANAVLKDLELNPITESGGTVVSSALELMHKIQAERYDPDSWNVYVAQASDGDNWPNDCRICRDWLVDKILPVVRYFAYVQVAQPEQNLWEEYAALAPEHPNFAMRKVLVPSDIYPVFRDLFKKEGATA